MTIISELLQIVAGNFFSNYKISLPISKTLQTNWNQIKIQSAETAADFPSLDVCWDLISDLQRNSNLDIPN